MDKWRRERGVTAIRAILVVVTFVILATPLHAEPGPVGRWLMNEPFTLWDHGMENADEAAEEAGNKVIKNIEVSDVHFAGASYDWDNNEIEIYFGVLGFGGGISHDICNRLRRDFLFRITQTRPSYDEEQHKVFVHSQIDAWFSHSGFQRKSCDEELAEKMARIIFVGVRLWPDSVNSKGIECRARILTLDAPSKPL